MALPKQGEKKIEDLIVAMPLPKLGYKIFFQQLWQWHCQKWGKKKGYEIYGRVKKTKSAMSTIFLQHFHNKSHVISYYQFKKICDKLIVEMALLKQVKFFFGNCGNVIAENGRKKKLWLPKSGEEFKKKYYVHNIFITFLQQITGNQLLLIQI